MINLITAHELFDGRISHVAMLNPPEHVPQHAVAQTAFGGVHGLDAQLAKHRRHDGEAAGEDGFAIVAQAEKIEFARVARAN